MKCWGLSVLALVMISALIGCVPARAESGDGTLNWGQVLLPVGAHKSLALRQEKIRITVGREWTKVDGTFVITNNGPACTIQIGSDDAADDEEGESNSPQLLNLRAFIDGASARSRLLTFKDGSHLRAHRVKFGARGTKTATRRVRHTYTLKTPGVRDYTTMAYYGLDTTESWGGKIERCEVTITFEGWSDPFRPMPAPNPDAASTALQLTKMLKTRGAFGYRGPGKATVAKRSITWVSTHWQPTLGSEVQIFLKS